MADEYISKEAFTRWIDETFCKKCEAEKRDYRHCRCGSCEYDYMRCDIEAFPSADVVPVVRCKDCRHRDPEDHKCDSGEFERQGCPFKVADNYFCAYGERR